MIAPPSSTNRIIELDALRGLAVIGIVWMNVFAFALPLQAYYNPTVWGWESAADRIVWATSFVFIEDKFRTIFAILFGAGCLILLEKGGKRPWRGHFARMTVLFAIGLAHSVLFASNDILRAYAIGGLAIPFLAGLSHRALYVIAIGLVAVHVGGGIVLLGGALVDHYAGRIGTDAVLFAERTFGSNEGALGYALELGREGWGERIVRRLGAMPQQITTLFGTLPLNLAAVVLGMALWKDHLLSGRWRTFRIQRLAALCAILALPALFAQAWWLSSEGFPPALTGAVALVLSAPFDTLLGLAYVALGMAFFSSHGWLTKALARVGKLSLTNYLMTSVILAAIFASWGLGMFSEVSRAQAFALSFIPIAAMLLWSPLWLAKFGQGPFERLWRVASQRLS